MTRSKPVARLDLIVEAVLYVQKVRALGMKSASYDKALREPIHFYWERARGPGKRGCVDFVSLKLAESPKGTPWTYEHTVPFAELRDKLLDIKSPTCDEVEKVLRTWCVTSAITESENAKLKDFPSKMPPGWDGKDVLARYKAPTVDIEVRPNDQLYEAWRRW